MQSKLMALSAAGLLLSGCLGSSGSSSQTTTPDSRNAAIMHEFEIIETLPAFAGSSFGDVGSYEIVNAKAHLWLDPLAEQNQQVVDLEFAPKNSEGYVEYSTDVVILRPADLSAGRRVVVYDVPNRGSKVINRVGNDVGLDSDMTTAEEAGNGFLMRQGYTMVWSGWQHDTGNLLPTAIKANLPVATTDEGPLTGQVHLEHVFNNTVSPTELRLEYPAVDMEKSRVSLTVRQRNGDTPFPIPDDDWEFTSPTTIAITRNDSFDAGAIFQITYTAKDPIVAGLGFTATRDLLSFLRYENADAQGNPNPLLDLSAADCETTADGSCLDANAHIELLLGTGVSQSSRYLRDYLWQGFNTDTAERQVFDGIIPFIAGSRKTFTNTRFGMPDRFSRQHEENLVPGNQFPFHYPETTDPVTAEIGGLLDDCSRRNHCPKILHMDNSSEFWQAGASLVGTDGDGQDIEQPSNVRLFAIAGAPHIATPPGPLYCKYPGTPMNYRAVARGLLSSLNDWTAGRSDPPASQWPRLDRDELAHPGDQTAVGFPDLSNLGIDYNGVANLFPVVDYSVYPPQASSSSWKAYVMTTDTDGNDLAGVRLPDISVPLGTYLGWNHRAPGFAEGELCFLFGSFIPFAQTETERLANGDPRPSLEERYGDQETYVAEVRAAAEALVAEGVLLAEDVARYVFFAQNSSAFDGL